ncbi:MAG: helix-turn-helix transcriptional regulator [Chloroflexi bacterium]|nr:helix-turn-helix transcriptional regulator [Chloroflexota bacterium]
MSPHDHWNKRPRRGYDFWQDWQEQQTKSEGEWEERHSSHHHHEERKMWRDFFYSNMGQWPESHWIFGSRRFSPWQMGMDTFNPFVATLLSKGAGLLPLYVLLLISQKPRYGNEVMQILAERTGGQWISNPGAIYPLLALIEKMGFIQGEWEDPTKRSIRVYTITPAGKKELERLKGIVLPKLEETVDVLEEFIRDLNEDETNRPAPDSEESSPGEAA